MMRHLWLTACLAVAIGMTASVTQAKESPAVRHELTQDYARFTQAFKDNDIEAFGAMMTSDYTAVAPGGEAESRTHVLADLKQRMAMTHDVSWTRTITNLSVQGKTAVATVQGDFTGTSAGRDGKDHTLRLLATTRDTWVHTLNDWKLAHSQVVAVTMTMDGKPMGGH